MFLKNVLDKTGAVERPRAFGTPHVRAAYQARRQIDDIAGKGIRRQEQQAHRYRVRASCSHGSPYRCAAGGAEIREEPEGKMDAKFLSRLFCDWRRLRGTIVAHR